MDKPGTLDKSRFAYSTRISSDGRHPRVQAVAVNNAAHLGPDGDPALALNQRHSAQTNNSPVSVLNYICITIAVIPLPFRGKLGDFHFSDPISPQVVPVKPLRAFLSIVRTFRVLLAGAGLERCRRFRICEAAFPRQRRTPPASMQDSTAP
jgi:hypothetical protein